MCLISASVLNGVFNYPADVPDRRSNLLSTISFGHYGNLTHIELSSVECSSVAHVSSVGHRIGGNSRTVAERVEGFRLLRRFVVTGNRSVPVCNDLSAISTSFIGVPSAIAIGKFAVHLLRTLTSKV